MEKKVTGPFLGLESVSILSDSVSQILKRKFEQAKEEGREEKLREMEDWVRKQRDRGVDFDDSVPLPRD